MPLLKGKGPACQVAAVKKLFFLVSALPSDPLFTFHRTKAYSQSRLFILTYSSLMLYLQCWLEQVGYQPFVYSCHSLNRGRGCLTCFCKNTLVDPIKHLGDWRSECSQQYLEDDLALCLSAAVGSLL